MPYRTLENVIDGVVITFADASASRALEIAAREQASQLRQMAESLPNLVWGARADGAFDYISKQWLEYTGVSDEEQQLWGWLEQVHAADRERVRDEWRKAVRTGTSFDSEFRIRSATGAYRWFKTRSVPIRDSSGAIVKWYGTSTDIDNLKRADDRLVRALQVISDGFIGVDKAGTVQRVNPAAAALLGRDDLLGASIREVLPGVSLDDGRDSELGSLRVTAQQSDDGGLWLFLRRPA
jgi:PAS domain S-box-containing protein